MPPLPAVPNVIRVRLLSTIQGKENQGLRWFLGYSGSNPTVAALTSFSTTLETALSDNLPDITSVKNTYTETIMEDLSSDTGAVYSNEISIAGLDSGDPLPPGTAMVASYEISRRYRGGHPRSYWPLGTASDMVDAPTWDPAFVTSCEAALISILGSLNGVSSGGCTISNQVNVSLYSGFTSVENPLTHRYRNVPSFRGSPVVDPVESVICRSYIGSIRRRRPKTS